MGPADPDPRFRTTRWSMVLSARAKNEPGSAEALSGLCEAYWYPLYSFARRSGRSADDARDLTQGYFLRLMERDYLDDVRQERGKFRSFLLASMKHYMANEHRDATAQKRGGGEQPLSLDFDAAETRYRNEPADDRTPEKAYERQWALALVARARERMRVEFDDAGKGRQYRLLARYLSGEGDRPYKDVAVELETTEAAVKMAISRMRRHFGKVLRELIAETVGPDEEVDAEVRHLLSIVR
jgi:RNA polymerase sigma-70 factor (ECF subfamily)